MKFLSFTTNNLKKLLKNNKEFFFGLLILLIGLCFIYKDVILKGQIIFPSNLQSAYFSPWSTQKFQGWEHGIPYKPIGGHDQVRFLYPARTVTNDSLFKGKIPQWNPYIFAGSPHVANYQSAVFYPFNILYFVLPQIDAWSVLTVLPFILAYVFAYLFNRSIGVIKGAGVIGALAFGLCAFISTWTQENAVVGQTAVWLPLILYGIERTIQTKKARYFAIIALSIACSVFAGFFQITFYSIILSLFYIVIRTAIQKNDRLYTLFLCISGVALGLGLSAIQLIPSIEAFSQSTRASSNIKELFDIYLLSKEHVITLLFPDFQGNTATYTYFGKGFYHEKVTYIGIVPLVFALYACWYIRRNYIVKFFLISAVISLVLTIRSPLTEWLYSQQLPIISTFVPSRILYITSFSLTVLAALGASWFFNSPTKKISRAIIRILSICGLVMFLPTMYVIIPWQNEGVITLQRYIANVTTIEILPISSAATRLKAMVIPWLTLISISAILIVLRNSKISLYLSITLTAIPLIYFLNRYSVVGYREFLYPNHEIFKFLQNKTVNTERFLVVGERLNGNLAVHKKLFSPEGVDAVFPLRYGEIAEATKQKGKLVTQIPRIDVTFPELEQKDNERQLKLLSSLGVKYIMYYKKDSVETQEIKKLFPTSKYKQIWNSGNWYGFENRASLPRTFLVSDYVIESNKQKILNKFFSQEFDPSQIIILEQKVDIRKNNKKLQGKAKIIQYEPEFIALDIISNKDAFLFLSDNFYPGWEAYIDGKKTKIHRANYSFRSVIVPEGEHKIIFVFNSKALQAGTIVSLLSLGTVVVLLIKRSKVRQ